MIKKKSPTVLIQEVRKNLTFGFGDLRDVSYVKAKNDSGAMVGGVIYPQINCGFGVRNECE